MARTNRSVCVSLDNVEDGKSSSCWAFLFRQRNRYIHRQQFFIHLNRRIPDTLLLRFPNF